MLQVCRAKQLASIILLTCGCSSQLRVPEPQMSALPVPAGNVITETFSNMVLVTDPAHSFRIDPYEMSELASGEFFSVRNQLPRTGLTPAEANKVCASLGKRLCTASEWTNACLGSHRRTFSFGTRPETGKCNTSSLSLARTGTQTACKSDEGVYDMVGNTMEWIGEMRGNMAVAAGGSMHTGETASCFTNLFFPSDARSDQIGFRCCRNEVKQ
ncbi:MAG: SUMF1/EgtB/PvdO family nonheme iron enzyme [Leptospirales bacterium]|nr:SUMF1/EgtB/PvdO family nonheme iron enzyme [Leptospirales bacterium]